MFTPVTTPGPDVTVAIAVLLLLHVPPLVPWLSAMPIPTHISDGPLISAGASLTVTVVVLEQPAALV